MIRNAIVLTCASAYFISWAHFSQWSLYDMLFYENDIKATFARLVVGVGLLIAAAVTVAEARS